MFSFSLNSKDRTENRQRPWPDQRNSPGGLRKVLTYLSFMAVARAQHCPNPDASTCFCTENPVYLPEHSETPDGVLGNEFYYETYYYHADET